MKSRKEGIMDRVALQRLLGDFADRLNGAIDFWTVVCLGTMPIDRRNFLLEKSKKLRAALEEIASVVVINLQQQDLGIVLDSMKNQCHELENAFLVLERFRTVNLEELHAATDAICKTYLVLRESAMALVGTLGLDAPDSLALNPERAIYFAGILDKLFETARLQRTTAAPEAAGNL
jgi:hypothetical protein